MMKNLFILCLILTIPMEVFSQIKSVSFSPEKNQINAGLPLPSEERFLIQGLIPSGIRRVEVKIFKTNKKENSAETYTWKAAYLSNPSDFEIYVAYPLRSNDTYTLKFYYFNSTDTTEMKAVKEAIHENLETYLNANFVVNKKEIKALVSQKAMLVQLNEIVTQGLSNYSHQLDQGFSGFSDVVKQKIEQIHGIKLKDSKFNLLKKSVDTKGTDNAYYAKQVIDQLIDLTKAETNQYLRSNLLMLVDIREINNYPTEKKPNYLPINIGYAGTYFGGGFNDLDYGTSAFAGISMPLGNKNFTKILGNASISTGVFFSNMTNASQTEISGPLIGRPSYIGLGYSLFRILRFNAGAVLTSTEINNKFEDVTLYPFVGFSAEFHIWLGLKR
ncbi:hypothetical protein [Cyclobacterium marinum]|nr:hypothetical protein [Cyclobacterium marinum]